MSSLLTTRFLLKQQAGISGSTDDTLLDRLIADVSEAIERKCDRTFGTATYRQWLDGTGTRKMILPNSPITNIYMVTGYYDDVMTVMFTGGEEASVSVTSSSVLLHSVSTAGAETSTTLALATYKTVTTLAAQINLTAGWTAVIQSGMETRPTTLLRPMWADDATDPNLAELTIASETDKIRVSWATQRAIESADGFGFTCGKQNIFVWYVAGYTLPVDNTGHTALETAGDLPGGLVYAVNGAINDSYLSRKRDFTLKSESIGAYSYSNADTSVAAAVDARWRELSPYARKTL
ncbi:MAG: phage head-tail connector protein [Dehalococcoidales bacterium]|nr:phage head-tail connector protein [Dehalococcoidales bacterium]